MSGQEEQKAVLYPRASTNDKDQRPERQERDMRDWCEKHGVEVVGVFTDEGTSATKTNPFERPVFMKALEAARNAGAAVLVEKHDRFTRQGTEEHAWAKVEMRRRHGVGLWIASVGGPDDQDVPGFRRVEAAWEAEKAAEWSRDHGQRVASGIRHAKRLGKQVGRPRKEFNEDEKALMDELADEGWGVRRIAHEINKRRGVYELAEEASRRRRKVGRTLVHEYLQSRSVA